MEEVWEVIPEFPNYAVSSSGRIHNLERDRPVALSVTRQGGVKVGLSDGIKQRTRSVKILVADAFVLRPREIEYDTAMLLDGNQLNLYASNIVWRPRWFALKYA